MKRQMSLVLAFLCVMLCLMTSASAAAADVGMLPAAEISRASGAFDLEVKAGKIVVADKSLELAKGEKVTITAQYTPKNAEMDFGLIDEDNVFHFITVSSGSISKTIIVPENGTYRLAIRNSSNVTVTVSGAAKY